MTMTRKLIYTTGLLFTLSTPVFAATLVEYAFTNPTETIAEATFVAPNVDAQDAAFAGFGGNGLFSSATNTAYVSSASTGSSLDTGNYLEVSISVVGNNTLDIESISFDLGGTNSDDTQTFTVYSSIRSNAEAVPYTSDLVFTNAETIVSTDVPPTDNTPVLTTYTANVTGSEYNGREEITFRIYLWDSIGSRLVDRVTNITITGEVTPVPEASTAYLLGGTLLFIGIWTLVRRRSGNR